MGQTNRNLAAKAVKAKAQRIDAGKLEGSKSVYNTVKMSDGVALTSALVSRSDVVAVQGRDIRVMPAATKMRTYLRSMF